MYKEFYKLKAMPFTQETDQKSIFLSENFETPLAVLVSGLDKGIKLHAVYGEQGVGKTTFIKYVYQHIQHHCKAGFVNKGHESIHSFLTHVIEGLDHKVKGSSIFDLLDRLRNIMEEAYIKNRKLPTLLVIDDADKLNPEIFETIKHLLMLNIDNNPILQLILVGNDQLLKTLDSFQTQTKSEKIEIVRTHLKPLTYKETNNYIHHRLKIVGSLNQHLFNEQTCLAIYELSRGIPYKINSLCHQALSLASRRKVNQISPNLINELKVFGIKTGAVEQLDISKKAANDSESNFNQDWKNVTPLVGVMSFVLLVFGIAQYFSLKPENSAQNQTITAAKTPSTITDNQDIIASNQTTNEVKIKLINKIQRHKHEPIKRAETNIQINEPSKLKKIKPTNQNSQINSLLAKAERQLSDGKLLTPTNDNAYSTYTAILSKAPSEQKALTGLQRIAERYLTLANNKIQQGKLSQSTILVNRGLRAAPDHQKLIALNNQINFQLAAKKQDIKIQALIRQANQQLENLDLSQPKNNNAYLTYLEVLNIDARNSDAIQGIDFIERQLTQRIQSLLDKKNYKSALLMASKITLMPSAESHLKSAVKIARQSEGLVANKIATLINEAAQQSHLNQYLSPKGNNAAETYRKILAIDQNNELANLSLKQINKHYQLLTKKALSSEKNKEALTLVNSALKAFPYNENLLELQNKTSIALSKQRLQIAGNVRTELHKMEIKKQLRPFGNF